MAKPDRPGGKVAAEDPHLPNVDDETARVLADSKLGVARPDDPAGESEAQALSESKLGAPAPGGPKDPKRTGDADRPKPD